MSVSENSSLSSFTAASKPDGADFKKLKDWIEDAHYDEIIILLAALVDFTPPAGKTQEFLALSYKALADLSSYIPEHSEEAVHYHALIRRISELAPDLTSDRTDPAPTVGAETFGYDVNQDNLQTLIEEIAFEDASTMMEIALDFTPPAERAGEFYEQAFENLSSWSFDITDKRELADAESYYALALRILSRAPAILQGANNLQMMGDFDDHIAAMTEFGDKIDPQTESRLLNIVKSWRGIAEIIIEHVKPMRNPMRSYAALAEGEFKNPRLKQAIQDLYSLAHERLDKNQLSLFNAPDEQAPGFAPG